MSEGTPPASTVRLAAADDAGVIGELHVRSWRTAYRGIVPAEVLDALDPAERTRNWLERIERPRRETRVWVIERDERVIGFASTGLCRDSDLPPRTAELYAIYLDPDAFSTGAGRELLAHAVDDLRERGYPRAALWVLEENERARRFYEVAGWEWDGTVKGGGGSAGSDGWPDEVRYRLDLVAGAPGWHAIGRGTGRSDR